MSAAPNTPSVRLYAYCAHSGCNNTFIASSEAWPHVRSFCWVHTNDLYERHCVLDEIERARMRPLGPVTNAANPGYLGQ